MNEKLNMQDLIDLLTYKYNIPKKNVELFVKEFFDLVVYALENDKYLKIKGFGTFKLIDVDSRESINVNTGERFIIEGHSKISFTPDVSLKNSINKPFAHFETAILNDNIQFDNVENADVSEEVVSLHDDDTVCPSNEPIEEFHKQDSFSQEDGNSFDAEVADFYLGKDSVAPEKHEHIKTLSVEEIIAQEIKKADLEYGKKYKSKQESGLSVNVKTRRAFICSVTFIAIAFLSYVLYIFLNGDSNNRLSKNDLDSTLIAGSVKIPIDSGTIHNDTVHFDPTNKQSIVLNNKDDSIMKINTPPLETVDGTAAEFNKLDKYTISGTLTDYKLNEGETLTKLALKFYGTKALWPYIVKHNRSIISDPDNVPYGVIIKIPKLTEK